MYINDDLQHQFEIIIEKKKKVFFRYWNFWAYTFAFWSHKKYRKCQANGGLGFMTKVTNMSVTWA